MTKDRSLVRCLGKGCPDGVGRTVFHGHIAALTVASGTNRQSKQKVVKVIVKEGHFQIVKV